MFKSNFGYVYLLIAFWKDVVGRNSKLFIELFDNIRLGEILRIGIIEEGCTLFFCSRYGSNMFYHQFQTLERGSMFCFVWRPQCQDH